MDNFKSQLETFLIDNKVMGYTAGFCIALVTKDVIQSLITDIFIPVILILLSYIKIQSIVKILPKSDGLNIIKFINYVVTWIIMIVVTFLFIQMFMNSLSNKTIDISNNIIHYQY
jgi:large-conductance mechanosensitive channel